ncbi:galactosylceramide sulfotransferase-like [Babylonia areolata]|uniref:galactosylceramide sulfotransferase-like n=1 Tax=Babylonia areolata TaxID=304850 RepID=UPI003FD2A6EB
MHALKILTDCGTWQDDDMHVLMILTESGMWQAEDDEMHLLKILRKRSRWQWKAEDPEDPYLFLKTMVKMTSGSGWRRDGHRDVVEAGDGPPGFGGGDEGGHRGPTLKECSPRPQPFFEKVGQVHKAGSSTVANILQRYGFARGLNFVLPRKRVHSQSYNYLSLPNQTLTLQHLIPPPSGQHYHLLWNHAIYDGRFFHQLMPRDTFFFAILRHPLAQFVSSFEYYGRMTGGKMKSALERNDTNPLALYLHYPDMFPWQGGPLSYTRNKQSQDLGMNVSHVQNGTLRRQYLQQLGRDFHWVMITEYFDESLVILRRLLCWEIRDILYIPRNKNPFKKNRVFTPEDRQVHYLLNEADYDLSFF